MSDAADSSARGRRSNRIGRAFEQSLAKKLGAKLVPGSGSKWYAKLDIQSKSFLWSLKATEKTGIRITKGMIDEAISAARSIGADPGIAMEVDGEILVIHRFEDFKALVTEDIKLVRADKGKARFDDAKLPAILREEAE